MSSVLEPQPDPQPADEIVAYLDGELAPQDCRRVEGRLASDEEYRKQLHELDRAWEALDTLPTTTVDDSFARTTIELACVAAESDLSDQKATAKASNHGRAVWWTAAGMAAVVFGIFAGRALIPNRNDELVADLPAIQQLNLIPFNVLPYVKDVDFLRALSDKVPLPQMKKDNAAFNRNVIELEKVNSLSLETRREWIQSLPSDQKADLAARARVFDELDPSSGERERMRRVMDDIRNDPEAKKLQQTLIAYGQWLSRHNSAQLAQLQDDLEGLSADERAELVSRRVAKGDDFRRLSPEDADTLRREIFQLVREKRPDFTERILQSRKAGQLPNIEGPLPKQVTQIIFSDQGPKREETVNRLIGKLSQDAQTHWANLGRGQREFGGRRMFQLWVWFRDAMNLSVDPEDLERFFASDKLDNTQRQRLLEEPRARMESELEHMYLQSTLGIENPGRLFGDFGEFGRMQRGGPGPAGGQRRPDGMRPGGPDEPVGPDGRRPPRRFAPNRPGPEGPPPPDRRFNNGPDDRGRPNGPRPPAPNGPPPEEQKQEAV